MNDSAPESLEQLQAQIELLKQLRGSLPDDQLDRLLSEKVEQLATLSGQGAIAQSGGLAVAATGESSTAAGKIGRDLIANNKIEWFFVQINNQTTAPDPAEKRLRELKQRYLQNLAQECDVLRLSDLGGKQEVDQTVRLSQVYIGLNTTATIPLTAQDKEQQQFLFQEERPLSAMEAAAQSQSLALVGLPGSGKSTFVRQLTAWLALAHLGDEEALTHLAGWAAGDWPFLLNLRDLAPALAAIPTSGLSTEEIERQLVAAVEEGWQGRLAWLCGPEFAPHLSDLLAHERLFLIFDGLDEVAEGLRPRVRQAIDALRRAPQLRVGRMIVTSRVRSYTEQNALSGFNRYKLRPFDKKQVNNFIAAWYGVQGQLNHWEKSKIETQINDLQQAISQDSHLFELAQNPLLLTVMAIIHQQQVRLPPQRVQLYNRAVQLLLSSWQENKGLPVSEALQSLLNDTATMRGILQQLAYTAHLRQSQMTDRQPGQPPATLSRGDILQLIDRKKLLALGLIDEFLEYVDKRAGLLRGLGGSQADERPAEYDFPHRTFQEYLAGCQLVTGLDHAVKKEYWARAAEGDYWYVAAQYGAETLLHSDQPQRDRLLDLAYNLCQNQIPTTEKGWRAALWSGQMAAQVGISYIEAHCQGDAPSGSAYLNRLKLRLQAIITEARLPAIERAEASNVLAQLGDPRPEVMTIDGMQFCAVPAGPFLMGSDDDDELARDNEKPQHQVDLEYGYWLARYPVTVAQWQEFVAGSGHQPTYKDSLQDPLNRPVRNVTWHEGVKFCEWLTDRWQKAGMLPTGWQVRLPSEGEWEKAARGGLKLLQQPVIDTLTELELAGFEDLPALKANDQPQRRYPWGKEIEVNLVNYEQTGIGTTSGMGCFPGGGSPYGVEEMSGNVWEWCATVWQRDYQDYQNDNDLTRTDVLRVMRGGALYHDEWFVRCAFRLGNLPNGRGYLIGFRVSVSPLL